MSAPVIREFILVNVRERRAVGTVDEERVWFKVPVSVGNPGWLQPDRSIV